ncbi:MAG: site-specific integrase [Candidatus Bathyarchaeota archaeon]
MSHDIYNYPKRMERVLVKVRDDPKVSDRNKELLLGFYRFCLAESLSAARVVRCLYAMVVFAEWTKKDFDNCNREDVTNMVYELEKDTRYVHATRQEMKMTLRKFFKWMRGTDEYPDEVKGLKCHRNMANNKLPEELLTEDEVKLLIDTADNPRDKALLAVLYESGCRIGELLSLKIKNVTPNTHGAHLMVNGKTGMRMVLIIASVPYLMEWLNKHPQKRNPEAPIWMLEKKMKELSHSDIQRILRKIRKRSGITKRINAHNFRHSRATFLASRLSDAVLKEVFGWTQSSKMASVYIHLSGKTVDDALLRVNGIETKAEGQEATFVSKKCDRCDAVNPPTNKFCSRCGTTLDKEIVASIIEKDIERRKADNALDNLIQNDQEFREMLLSKLKETLKS